MKLGFRMLLGMLLALALLASSLPQPAAAAAPAQTCAKEHTVASGDTLSKLSVTYNVSIQELATANNLKEPYVLIIGTKLCIPGSTTTTTTTGTTTGASSDKKTAGVTVSIVGKRLSISLTNFPGKSIYYVKARDLTSRTNPEIKLGRIRADKAGAGKAIFRVSDELLKARRISLCFKNAVDDKVSCRVITLNTK